MSVMSETNMLSVDGRTTCLIDLGNVSKKCGRLIARMLFQRGQLRSFRKHQQRFTRITK